jgi:hypothetical protein
VDTSPIITLFTQLLTAGAAIAAATCAFFVMLAGYQWMTAGGSVRGVESARGSLYNALIGFAIVILCKVIANLVGGALGSPSQALGPTASLLAFAGGLANPSLLLSAS